MFSKFCERLYFDIDPAVESFARIVRELERQQQHPVRTITIAARYGWAERTVRYYLRQAERAGLVNRQCGSRGGWSTRWLPEVDVNQLIQLPLPERGQHIDLDTEPIQAARLRRLYQNPQCNSALRQSPARSAGIQTA